MAKPLRYEDAVDLGHGRGRAAGPAAASIRRIDAQLRRPADINEAWRSPEQANANRARWIAYSEGRGPWAPYALGAEDSVHCLGYAADSDDWYNTAAASVWRDNGWRQTARYPGTARDEIWHGEYFAHLDLYYGQSASGNAAPFTPPPTLEENDMLTISWEGHLFTFGPQQVLYHDSYKLALDAAFMNNRDRAPMVLSADGMTAACQTYGVPWSAVDACMQRKAYDLGGNVGGTFWSRHIEHKIDTANLARSLDELRRTAADVPVPVSPHLA